LNEALIAWLELLACGAVIAVAGARLSRYGDILADKLALPASWIGLVLMASVTSLPELVAGVSAVAAAEAPNIAVGDALGSCVFNLAVLVVVDFLHRDEPVYRRASQGHILSAGFGVVMIGFAGLNVLLGAKAASLAVWQVGAYAPIIAGLYLVAMRSVYQYEREQFAAHVLEEAGRYPGITSARAWPKRRAGTGPSSARCSSPVRHRCPSSSSRSRRFASAPSTWRSPTSSAATCSTC
jgi:cation:H+ antiporter